MFGDKATMSVRVRRGIVVPIGYCTLVQHIYSAHTYFVYCIRKKCLLPDDDGSVPGNPSDIPRPLITGW